MRVVGCKYGAYEKSAMLTQPNRLAVFITDLHVKIALPNGKSRKVQAHAGEAKWGVAETHRVQTSQTDLWSCS